MTPAASGPASQATRGATFSGAMASNAPSGTASMVSAKSWAVIRVRPPGAIALTVTPYLPNSMAVSIVKPRIPILAVV